MACIALVEWRQSKHVYPGDETIKILLSETGLFANAQEATKKLEEMISKGYRYKNLEDYVGAGIAFVLGCETSESL